MRTSLQLSVSLLLASCWSGLYMGNGSSVRISLDDQDVVLERAAAGGPIQVAVYHDGRLGGVDALRDLDHDLYGAIPGSHDCVDHPRLAEWREQARALEELGGAPEAGAEEFAGMAQGLPFPSLVSAAALRFAGEDSERAARLLPLLEGLEVRDRAMLDLLRVALRADGLTDERLAGWTRWEPIRDEEEAARMLLACRAAGPRTARAVLAQLEDYYGSDRLEIFKAAAARLAADPEHADVLVRGMQELYGSDQGEVALWLIERAGASAELGLRMLVELDDFYGSDRPRLYLAAAERTKDDPRAHRLIVDRLDELYGSDRVTAALELLSVAGDAPTIVAPLVENVDTFYGSDRVQVLEAVVDGPAFADPAVRLACIRATAEELYASDRRAMFSKIARKDELSEEERALLERYRAR